MDFIIHTEEISILIDFFWIFYPRNLKIINNKFHNEISQSLYFYFLFTKTYWSNIAVIIEHYLPWFVRRDDTECLSRLLWILLSELFYISLNFLEEKNKKQNWLCKAVWSNILRFPKDPPLLYWLSYAFLRNLFYHSLSFKITDFFFPSFLSILVLCLLKQEYTKILMKK